MPYSVCFIDTLTPRDFDFVALNHSASYVTHHYGQLVDAFLCHRFLGIDLTDETYHLTLKGQAYDPAAMGQGMSECAILWLQFKP